MRPSSFNKCLRAAHHPSTALLSQNVSFRNQPSRKSSSSCFLSMRAIVVGDKRATLDEERSVPVPRDDQVLVRPVAVALNPTDWRHIAYGRAKPGCIVGCDYAGVVEWVGSAVKKSWKPGDRIFGSTHGANLVNPDDGVFSERAAMIGDLQMRMPVSMSFEEAATLGLGSITVGQGLFQKALKLDLPLMDHRETQNARNNDKPVLIYGGSSATGALGIQFAKQAGYRVITVCAPEHAQYVTSLGADVWVNYLEGDPGSKIRKLTNDSLVHAWDTISIESSAKICASALTSDSSKGPVYGSLLPVDFPRPDVKVVSTVMYTAFGRDFQFGPTFMPASQEDYEFGKTFCSLTEKLLEQGQIRPHRHSVRTGGLEGVIQGLRDLQDGKVAAEKLVYRVQGDRSSERLREIKSPWLAKLNSTGT